MTNNTDNYEQPENHENDDANDDDGIISKSQRKRDADAAQQLGKDILGLSHDAQNSMDLPESLVKALDDARRIKKNSALNDSFNI